jgi:putative PIG3 family NAD(P)H quinone oxidoreductase
MENQNITADVIEITGPGGPEVLTPATRRIKAPSEGEVLIKTEAIGVNRPDVIQRLGLYPPPPGASDIPGLEVAGIIMALGSGVDKFKLGDEVIALVQGGGYASHTIASIETTLPLPKGLSMVEGAGIPETFFTVWSNLFDRARLMPGESMLIHGGTSGIGTTAIQLAKAFGHTVYATAGSDEKCKAAKSLGADLAINYKTQDFEQVIKSETDGMGVNVIIDMVGGDYIEKNLNCLGMDGRVVSIAFLQGSAAKIDFMKLMLKRLTITGSTLRPRDNIFKGNIANSLIEKVWPLIEAGKIKPVINSTFPLHDARLAHELMEASTHIGKIILIP